MRIRAALKGDLDQIMRQELKDATRGVRVGMTKGTNALKGRLRSQARRAGMSKRFANTWRSKIYDNGGLNVAGLVYSKAPKIARAHAEGVTIRAKKSRFLAIPTENVPKNRNRRGRFTKRISPRNWPEHLYGRLRFVKRRRGPHFLVADEVRISKTGRVTKAKRTKTGRMGRGARTAVMFILLRLIRLRRRFDLPGAEKRVLRVLPDLIGRAYRDAGSRAA